MSELSETRPMRTSALRLERMDNIPVGQSGYGLYPFTVDASQLDHDFIISVTVHQLPNRLDDIQFYLTDASGYEIWKTGQRASAVRLIPRIVSGSELFRPSSPGVYYVILDNRHSSFTTKAVTISITEEWLVQREVKTPVPTVAPKSKEKVSVKGIWGRVQNWFRRFPFATLIIAFLAIETTFLVFGFAIVNYANSFWGIRNGDPWPLLAALAAGGVVVFGIFYSLFTGRALPFSPGM